MTRQLTIAAITDIMSGASPLASNRQIFRTGVFYDWTTQSEKKQPQKGFWTKSPAGYFNFHGRIIQ